MDLRLKKCSALLAVAVLTSFLTVNTAMADALTDLEKGTLTKLNETNPTKYPSSSAYTLSPAVAAGENVIIKYLYDSTTNTITGKYYKIDLAKKDYGTGSNTEYYQWGEPDTNGNRTLGIVDSQTSGKTTITVHYNDPKQQRITDTTENQDITGIFSNLTTGLYGAINNKTLPINSIVADFIGNYPPIAYDLSYGGGICNLGEYSERYILGGTAGTIKTITGVFIGNKTASNDGLGGAIFNNGTINTISANFISNSGGTNGGAVYNYDRAKIGTITGDFIGNRTTRSGGKGGAIFNSSTGTIETITGDFLGNYTSGNGGAIYNNGGTITTIMGDFIGNYASSSAAFGGAIFNDGTIAALDGNFIGNYASSSSSSLSIAQGGAIYNYGGTIATLTGDFIGNYASSLAPSGGAIYNNGNSDSIFGTINLLADIKDITFSDNTANGVSNAYHGNGNLAILNLNTGADKSIIFNDSITGEGHININKTLSQVEGVPMTSYAYNAGKVVLNQDMSGYKGRTNLYGGTLKMGTGKYNSNWDTTNHTLLSLNIEKTTTPTFFGGSFEVKGDSTLDMQNSRIDTISPNMLQIGLGDLSLAIDTSLNIEGDNALKADNFNIKYGYANSTAVINSINILNSAVKRESRVTFVNTDGDTESFRNAILLDDNLKIDGSTTSDYKVMYYPSSGELLFLDTTKNLKYFVNDPSVVTTEGATRTYNLFADENVTADLGNLAGTVLTINGANEYSIMGNNHKGVTVKAGQTLNVNDVNEFKNFATAITNRENGTVNISTTSFVNNTTDIINNGTLNLTSGTISLNNGITMSNSEGVTNIKGATVNAGAITQKKLTIDSGSLTINAENLINTNTVENNGILNLSGSLNKNIGGSGTTKINSLLNVAGDSTISGDFDLNNGMLDMQDASKMFSTLSVGNLKGEGDLKIDANMTNSGSDKATNNDKISITNITNAGTGTLNLTSIKVTQDGTKGIFNDYLTYLTGNKTGLTFKLNNSSAEDAKLESLTDTMKYTFTRGSANGILKAEIEAKNASLENFITGNGIDANTYNINSDKNYTNVIGTTHRDNATRELFLNLNNGADIIGNSTNDGITVASGYTLNIDGSHQSGATVKNFDKALINNGTLNIESIAFNGNTTDIENNATLNLDGTNLITTEIVGANGTTNIKSGTTTANSITQNVLNILSGGKLNIAANNLTATNGVSNAGTLELTGGDLASNITDSTGTLSIAGAVSNSNNKTIEQNLITIAAEKSFATDIDRLSLTNGITNAGDLTLNGGVDDFVSNNNAITGTNSWTIFTGKVTNNAPINQYYLIIDRNAKLENNTGQLLSLRLGLDNSGELTTRIIDLTIGGSLGNDLNAIINFDTTVTEAENDATIPFDIYNHGIINVKGSGAVMLTSLMMGDEGQLNIMDTSSITVKHLIKQDKIVINSDASLILKDKALLVVTTFENNGTLTADINDVITKEFTNNNILNLTSNKLSKNIAGTGTTVLQNNISIDTDRTIGGTLNANGKTIDLHQDPLAYQTLTVGSIKGNTDLKIDVDITNTASKATNNDKINITAGANSGYVNVGSINVTGDLTNNTYNNYIDYVTGTKTGLTYKLNGYESGDNAKLITLTADKKYTFTKGDAGSLTLLSQDYTGGLHEYIIGNVDANDFSINKDVVFTDNQDIGTTAGNTTKTIYINGGKTLTGFDGSTKHNDGITVANGYTLNVDGSNSAGAKIKNFKKALINNGILNVKDIAFENNTTDIENNANLNLDGTNSITAGIVGANGTTNVKSGETTANSINQKSLNILSGAKLNIKADNLAVTNGITNAGTLELTDGTNNNLIQGVGITKIDGEVINEAIIAQQIENNGVFQTNADKIGGAVSNDGNLYLTGGTLSHDILGSNTSVISLDNSIVNNAKIRTGYISLNNHNITGSGSLTLARTLNSIVDQLGTITQTGGLISEGALTARVGQIIAPITNSDNLELRGGGDENDRMANTNTITDTQDNKTGTLTFNGFVKNDAAIVQKGMTISSEANLENTAMITLRNDSENVGILTNNGTLTSSADKISATIKNVGTYNILGGTLNNQITEKGTINLTSGQTLIIGRNGLIGSSQTFNAASNSTLSLIGPATSITFHYLTIQDKKVDLEIDWGDTFNVTGGLDSQNTVNLSKINLTSTEGLNDTYTFTNMENKLILDKNIELIKEGGSTYFNSVKYDNTNGSLSRNRLTLVSAIAGTSVGGTTVYVMSGNESAGNKTVESDFIIQNNAEGDINLNITGGMFVGNGSTITNKTLTLKDVGVQNVIVGVDQKGAIHVRNSNKLEIIADKKNINIQGTTGGDKPAAIYLENGAGATFIAFPGKRITVCDNIISESVANKILFSGSGDIVLSGILDPATIDVSATTTREAAYADAGVTLTTYDEGIAWNLNADGSVKYDNDNILYNPAHHTTPELLNSMNFNGGSLDMRNGAANTIALSALTLSNNSNLYLDVDLANKTMDKFTSPLATYTGGTLNVDGLNLISDAAETLTTINFTTDANLMGHVDYTGAQNITALSPIYRYNVGYENTTGNFNFTRSGGHEGFNPAILASPIAAQVGSYLTQLNNYEQAFANMDMMMLMTKKQRQAMKFANKYASTQGPAQGGAITYDPNQIPEQDKGAWFRPFATFENVGLKNGPTVGNTAYGSLFGGDSPIIELSHGWDMVYSAYAGYNGSHQTYDGVGIYQNGGTLGGSASFYKGNFFTGLTANVGANVGSTSTMYGNEDFTMLTTGIASKTGYNWELADGKFIIQPNWLMSYSFVNTFDYTNAAGVKINSDPLNAIQIAPGIKFIGNLKNSWQPYASVQMVWNIMDQTKFSANDVSLPELSVKPYIQYGVGLQKRWGDRFTAFGQAMIRNGGRNGIALQFGARWALGKDPAKSKASGTIKKMKETNSTTSKLQNAKLNLSSMR